MTHSFLKHRFESCLLPNFRGFVYAVNRPNFCALNLFDGLKKYLHSLNEFIVSKVASSNSKFDANSFKGKGCSSWNVNISEYQTKYQKWNNKEALYHQDMNLYTTEEIPNNNKNKPSGFRSNKKESLDSLVLVCDQYKRYLAWKKMETLCTPTDMNLYHSVSLTDVNSFYYTQQTVNHLKQYFKMIGLGVKENGINFQLIEHTFKNAKDNFSKKDKLMNENKKNAVKNCSDGTGFCFQEFLKKSIDVSKKKSNNRRLSIGGKKRKRECCKPKDIDGHLTMCANLQGCSECRFQLL